MFLGKCTHTHTHIYLTQLCFNNHQVVQRQWQSRANPHNWSFSLQIQRQKSHYTPRYSWHTHTHIFPCYGYVVKVRVAVVISLPAEWDRSFTNPPATIITSGPASDFLSHTHIYEHTSVFHSLYLIQCSGAFFLFSFHIFNTDPYCQSELHTAWRAAASLPQKCISMFTTPARDLWSRLTCRCAFIALAEDSIGNIKNTTCCHFNKKVSDWMTHEKIVWGILQRCD